MPHRKYLIIKLGGSIVTAKNRSTPTVRRTLIRKIGTVLAHHYSADKHALILIHGAGSFGHLHAKKNALAQGTKDHPEKIPLALENQSLNQHLHTEIIALLTETGLSVTGIPTHSVTTNARGHLHTFDTRGITAALTEGGIPVLYGDMISDTDWGFSICSGDILVAHLAHTYHAKEVFFASDVDGIYTSDPHLSAHASLIKKVHLNDIHAGNIALGASHNVDVTGGLSKKFSVFHKKSFPQLQKIYLFNGMDERNFASVFNPRTFPGTTITVKK